MSAAALVMALGASLSAQAAPTKLTFTEHDANGQTYTGGFQIDTPLATQLFGNGYYLNYFSVSNFTGIFQIPTNQSDKNPFTDTTKPSIFADTNVPFVPFGLGGQTYAFSDVLNTGNDFQESGALIIANDPGIYTGNEFIFGNYDLDLTQFSGQIYGDHYDSIGNLVSSSAVTLNPLSATLRVGPAAPAPLAGAGLLSALAALAALAMTRLLGRKGQLA